MAFCAKKGYPKKHLIVESWIMNSGWSGFDRQGEVNRRTGSGTTLLMCAAHARWPKIFGLLLSRGADWRPRDRDGRDALWFAVAASSLADAKLLLAAGADPNARDNKGEAPIDMLMSARMRALLIEHGGKPSHAEGN